MTAPATSARMARYITMTQAVAMASPLRMLSMLKVFRLIEMIEADLATREDLFDIGIGIANLISARSRDLVNLGIGAIALLLNVNVEDNACAIIIGIKLLPAGVTIHIDILALACQPL